MLLTRPAPLPKHQTCRSVGLLASQGPSQLLVCFFTIPLEIAGKNCCSPTLLSNIWTFILESGLTSLIANCNADCRFEETKGTKLAIGNQRECPGIALRCNRGVPPRACRTRNPLPQTTKAAGKTPAHPAKSDSKTRGRGKDAICAYTYSDWNPPRITCLFLLLEKEGDTMLTIKADVCALSNIVTLFFSLR
jgi:hypothetical protein